MLPFRQMFGTVSAAANSLTNVLIFLYIPILPYPVLANHAGISTHAHHFREIFARQESQAAGTKSLVETWFTGDIWKSFLYDEPNFSRPRGGCLRVDLSIRRATMLTSSFRAARAVWAAGLGLVALLGLNQPSEAQLSTIFLDLQIQTADSPTLRFHQLPLVIGVKPEYVWDVIANEHSMTLADVTANTDPVVVEGGTGTNTLYLSRGAGGAYFGDVGIGTSTPRFIGDTGSVPSVGGRNFHLKSVSGTARSIVQGEQGAETFLVQSTGAVGQKILRSRLNNGLFYMSTVPDTAVGFLEPYIFAIDMKTGNVGIRTPMPAYPLQIGNAGTANGNGAHVTTGGVWTNASSRSAKQDIVQITSEQALQTVRSLEPVSFRYKNELEEQYVGFIAEDVPELVATQDRKSLASMDIVAVLTKVVQDQDRKLDEQLSLNSEQKKTLADQLVLIEKQQQLLEALKLRVDRLEQR